MAPCSTFILLLFASLNQSYSDNSKSIELLAQSRREESLITTYFSPYTVSAIKQRYGSDMKLRSYAFYLSEMGEFSIYAKCKNSHAEIYRFLNAPSFSPPYTVTATREKNKIEINYTIGTQQGDETTKPLFTQTSKNLSFGEWVELQALLNKINFYGINVTSSRNEGLDGEDWLFEGCRAGKYHLVDRWSPLPNEEEESLIQLGELLIHLAKLDIQIRPFVANCSKESSSLCGQE